MASLVAQAGALLFDWRAYPRLCRLILLAEAVLSVAIVLRVPYTEIDWVAYMQEVEGWVVEGSTDYTTLRGDTGPLVYPAGFLYVYRALRALVGDAGRSPAAIRAAQWVFVGVYLSTVALVLHIYGRARPGAPWVALALAASKRVHSLFMLRLFNDCVTMALAYGAVALFMARRWYAGSLLYSLALSVKMNVLLFAPGLALLLVRNVGLAHSVGCAGVVVATQAALGAPFLLTFPASYLGRAFELGRVFFHTWTVNWKFVPEPVFVGKPMALALLAGHLATLLALAHWKWTAADGGLVAVCARAGLLPQRVARALLGPKAWGALLAGVAADVALARAAAEGGAGGDAAAPPLRVAKPVDDGAAVAASASDDVEGRSTPLTGSSGSDGDSPTAAAAATPGTRVSLRRRAAAAAKAAAAAPAPSSSSTSGRTPRASIDTSAAVADAPLAAGGGAASPVRRVPSAAAAAGMLPLPYADSPAYIAYVLLASNFVGIAFARTLHYQFYSWYFHALPALALGWGASSGLPLVLRLAALAAVEWAFNVGDAAGAGSPASSAALQVGHAVVLACLVLGRVPATGAAAAAASAPAARKAPA